MLFESSGVADVASVAFVVLIVFSTTSRSPCKLRIASNSFFNLAGASKRIEYAVNFTRLVGY